MPITGFNQRICPVCSGTNSFIILISIFQSLGTVSANGGGIEISCSGSSIRIKECVFDSCCAFSGGGCFLTSVLSINFELSCISKCNAVDWGHGFYSTGMNDSETNIQHVSMVKCSNNTLYGRTSLLMIYAKQVFKYNNGSRCIVSSYDIFLHYYSSEFTHIMNSCINNRVIIGINIADSVNGLVSLSNYINNTKTGSSYGLIFGKNTQAAFTDTYFKKNDQERFILSTSSSISISNCFLFANVFVIDNPPQSNVDFTEYPIPIHDYCSSRMCETRTFSPIFQSHVVFLMFLWI